MSIKSTSSRSLVAHQSSPAIGHLLRDDHVLTTHGPGIMARKLWKTVENHGKSPFFMGKLWKIMENCGKLWKTMENHHFWWV